MSPILQQFCQYYRSFDQQPLSMLDQLYSETIEFQDPAHRVSGLQSMKDYFSRSMQGVTRCQFDIHKVMEQGGEACISWEMTLLHPKLNHHQTIRLDGISHLRFGEKIDYHRDYFDLGQMVYEQIPLVGRIIKTIKKRLSD